MEWFEPNYSISGTVGHLFWPSSPMKSHLGINECMNQACLGILCLETIQFGIFIWMQKLRLREVN